MVHDSPGLIDKDHAVAVSPITTSHDDRSLAARNSPLGGCLSDH